MTEIDFLIDLLLDHKLTKSVQDVVRARMKYVQSLAPAQPVYVQPQRPQIVAQVHGNPDLANQSPSMQAIMARHADVPEITKQQLAAQAVQPAVVAQTPAAQAAMAHRAEVIANAGKPDASGKKRKW